MKFLVTGAAGFLGSHLCRKLIEQGHHVIGLDNLSGGSLENLEAIKDHARFSFNKLFCSDLKASNLDYNIDVLVHAACFPHEGLSVFSPDLVTQSVFSESVSIFTWAIQHKVKKIVYLSSMARYGNQGEILFQESMQPKPQDPYGIAKVAAEDVLKVLSKVHAINYTIAVPHNIYGPNQKYDDPFRNVVAIMLNRILQDKEVIIYGDGNQKRCFSYIDDVIDPLMQLCHPDQFHDHTFNLGPDAGSVTINELANLCFSVCKKEKKVMHVPDRPQEVKHANCSAEKARNFLNYNPKTQLKKGIIELRDFIIQKGVKDFNYHLQLEIINEKTPITWKNKIF